MSESKPKRIKQLLPAPPGWNVVTRGDDADSPGPFFLPVVALALVSTPHGDFVEAVAPHNPSEGNRWGDFKPWSDGDDNLMGLQQPGADDHGFWADVISEDAKEEALAEERQEHFECAAKFVAAYPKDHEIFVWLRAAKVDERRVPFNGHTPPPAMMVTLAEYDLVDTARVNAGSRQNRWHVTRFGQAVLAALDKAAE